MARHESRKVTVPASRKAAEARERKGDTREATPAGRGKVRVPASRKAASARRKEY